MGFVVVAIGSYIICCYLYIKLYNLYVIMYTHSDVPQVQVVAWIEPHVASCTDHYHEHYMLKLTQTR